VLILITPLGSSSQATIIHVPDDQPTIQAGIDVAFDGDTVLVAPGTYTGSGNTNVNFLGKAIFVTSEMGPDSTIVDAEGIVAYRFIFNNGETRSSVLNGFTLTHFASAIYIRESSPQIVNCRMVDCGGAYIDGGGMYIRYGSPLILNCSFKRCYLNPGIGGAISSVSSNPSIINSEFILCGAYIYGPDAAVHCDDALIVNCSFYNNSFYTIIGNPVVINCIFWESDWGDIWGNADVSYSDIEEGWPGEGNIHEDPLFVDPENENLNLSPDSPCIDAGDPNSPNVPWGGFRRDMGAFEFDQGFFWNGQCIILKPFPIEMPSVR
ncbi:MAG: right-handed parallel beta-helix repeat-containing protein, partial [Fidelibacterota bacterium]